MCIRDRVYIDSAEEAPKGVNVLTGKRGGLFYDMTKLTQEDHGNTITGVFDTLMDEKRELDNDKSAAGLNEKASKLVDEAEAIYKKAQEEHELTPEVNKLEDQIKELVDQNDRLFLIDIGEGKTEAGVDSDDITSEDEKALADYQKLADKQNELSDQIASDVSDRFFGGDPETDAGVKAYLDKHDEADAHRNQAEEHNTKLDNIHQKLGNALIHSFKVEGFKVDDMKFDVDPDLKYAQDSK